MNVILLSGGSGKRLWPISNGIRSKQFLKILEAGDTHKESMAQRMVRMINAVSSDSRVTIAAPKNQVHQLYEQLGDSVDISIEPSGRDTFPAVVLASAFLRKKGVGLDEPVVVCPVDQYVEEDYFRCLVEMANNVDKAKITLMGIEPTYPSDKYGYILPVDNGHVSAVRAFREKPCSEDAGKYISEGALWNGGVFAFRLGYVLGVSEKFYGTGDYDKLFSSYSELRKTSFDYAVVEKENDINVIRFNGTWKDIGTWDSLSAIVGKHDSENVISDDCPDTDIINELPIPIVSLGIRNSVVVASPDGILVCDKEKASSLKSFVPDSSPMFEERVWGEYRVIKREGGTGESYQVIDVTVLAGKALKIAIDKGSSHLVVAEGEGRLTLGNHIEEIGRGSSMLLEPGQSALISATNRICLFCIRIDGDFRNDIIDIR